MTHEALPRIVVTLPARGLVGAREGVQHALEDGADWVEIRLDRWPESERERVAELFPSPLPLVATYRSSSEGGEGVSVPAERAPVLIALAQHPFVAIDLELERDLPLAGDLARALATPGAPQRILSVHSALEVEPGRIARQVLEGAEQGSLAKIIFPASVGALVRRYLPQLPLGERGPSVVHTTGASGPLLRAWSRRLGMPLVYAAPSSRREGSPVEASQIPCDALRRFFSGGLEAPIFAVVGHPIAHSRSPALHQRWFESLDLAALYLALDIASAGELADDLPALSARGFRGLNVTHPLKSAALALADRAGVAAERARCANVLTLGPEGVIAENTDVPAIGDRLRELRARGPRPFDRITVLGSGGAARATLVAAQELGLPASVLARDRSQADALAREYGAESPDPGSVGPASLIVHATPAGRAEAPTLDLPVRSLLNADSFLLDLVYAPHHPFLRDDARARGAAYEDGYRVLVLQAARSFELWWDRPIPPEMLAREWGSAP
jgi:shikimate dehydrogenase